MTDTIDTPTILPPSLDTSLAAHFQAAHQLHVEGKLLEASEELKRALQVKPDSPEAHFNLANVVRDAGEVELAAQGFRAAIEFAKAKKHIYPDAQINLADALRRLGRHGQAIDAIRDALKQQPLRPEAHIGLALILIAQGKQSAAIARLQKAVKIAPDNVPALFQLGLALHWHSQWEEALAIYDRIKALNPEFLQARIERAHTLFRLGRITEGFAEYETRLQVPMLKRIQPADLKPGWDGQESLAGKTMLVYSEPGFIDEIQFARFVPALAAHGANVTVMVQEALRALFQSLQGVGAVTALGAAVPEHDISVSMMSLPHLLGVSGDTIPVEPYLSADPKSAATWAERMEGVKGKKIGVAWIGGQESGPLQGAPLKPETLATLRTIPGVTLISLQQRALDEKLPGLVSPGLMTDFAMAAGLIANLDMVITVDAAVAHLAAAMGKPVFLLLPIIPDAPWSVTGDTHPWYPTMRVFRQRRKGNWDEVMKRVGRELRV